MYKIGFFSESGYEGKVDRNNHPNLRTDSSWVCSLDATHHPLPKVLSLPDNSYDIGIMIIPKNRRDMMKHPIVENYKRVCKKVTIMQESYYNYWQDSPIDEQIWYFNFLTEMDMILCHNETDKKYYSGLTNVPCELNPTLMLTDNLVRRHESGNGVIIGGNWTKDYGGFDSYQVALEITDDITAITTGRMKEEESQVLKHVPWVMWNEWIDILSQYKYGVQLSTAAAGQFQLNCSYHGIPCIGYSNLNTQKVSHPLTTVDLGDIGQAKKIARWLKDESFYDDCMISTQELFEKHYSEEAFQRHWKDIIKILGVNDEKN